MIFESGGLSGLMTQPGSQYYLLFYGGYLGVAGDDGSLQTRLTGIYRPTFEAGGIEERDYGGFLEIGTTLARGAQWDLTGAFGYGAMYGEIEFTDELNSLYQREKETSEITGFSTQFAAGVTFWGIRLAYEHRLFTGFASEEQTELLVAWPYTFHIISAGYAF